MTLKQKILQWLPNIDPDILLMSRKNCHGQGLHSIVLDKADNGNLTRMFITDSSHKMWQNNAMSYNYSLGVHDHKYSITLTQIFGVVLNMDFREYTDEDLSEHEGVRKYQFKSQINGTGEVNLLKENCHLSLEAITALSEDPLWLHHTTLHTVFVPKGEVAAWLVVEGSVEKDDTSLFTNSVIDLDGCYESFSSKREVADFVNDLFMES